jgi:anti-sigma factor (TIGR02949 family)
MSTSTPMGCEEALRLLAQFLDRELADVDHADVDHHLSTCRSCYSRAEFERRLKAELTRLRTSDIPDRLEDRIRALLAATA